MAGTIQAAEVLAAVPYFTTLTTEQLQAIAEAAVPRKYDAGQVVFLEGESSTGLYVVQEGWLKAIKTSPTGREQMLRLVGPGDVFNDLSLFVGTTNVVTVVALEPVRAWMVRRELMLRLLDEKPGLARAILQNVAQRALHLLSLVEDLSLRTVEARLARLLLAQAADATISRRRWATQTEMANRLGTVPDVLNRALRALAEEGLIRVQRHQIEILNRPELQARAMIEEA